MKQLNCVLHRPVVQRIMQVNEFTSSVISQTSLLRIGDSTMSIGLHLAQSVLMVPNKDLLQISSKALFI